MKIKYTRFIYSTTDLGDYIRNNRDKVHTVTFNKVESRYEVTTTSEVTEPEFNMQNLQDIAHDNELTTEQQNAIDYGISAIKTLVDMGVIK